jgi:hypothetical protein
MSPTQHIDATIKTENIRILIEITKVSKSDKRKKNTK